MTPEETTYRVVQQIELDRDVSVSFFRAPAPVVDALVAKYGRFLISDQIDEDEWYALKDNAVSYPDEMTHQDLIVVYI